MTQADLTSRKLELEIAKLEKELSGDSNVWWVRPVYLSILAPLIVGLATFAWSYFSGVYDAERRKAEAELAVLELEAQEASAVLERRRTMAMLVDEDRAFRNQLREELCAATETLAEGGFIVAFQSWHASYLERVSEIGLSHSDLLVEVGEAILAMDVSDERASELVTLLREQYEAQLANDQELLTLRQQGNEEFQNAFAALQELIWELGGPCGL